MPLLDCYNNIIRWRREVDKAPEWSLDKAPATPFCPAIVSAAARRLVCAAARGLLRADELPPPPLLRWP